MNEAALARVEAARAERSKRNLLTFTEQAWHTVHPRIPFVQGWHIEAICDHLEAVQRREIRGLVINIPPRHCKSLTVGVFFPAWLWLQEPGEQIINASYNGRLAVRDAVRARRVMDSLWYRRHFSGVWDWLPDQNEKSRYENNQGGYRFATSTGGAATGEGGTVRILDDPHKADDVQSPVKLQSDLDWVRETWSTRANNPDREVEIVVMQRLHERDVTGYYLKEVGGYEHLMLPAMYEPKRQCKTSLPFEDPRTEDDEPLWPEMFGKEDLEKRAKKLGRYAADAQEQQRPSPRGGGIVKEDSIRYWSKLPDRFDTIIISADATFKETKSGSYVVLQAWGRAGAEFYLLDQRRERMDFTATIHALVALINKTSTKYQAVQASLIEEKANGAAIISTLKLKVPGLIPINPKTSKEARLSAVSPMFEAGNVLLPDPGLNPWVSDYVGELTTFPAAPHDDQVDATSQALDWFQHQNVGFITVG